MIIAKTPNSFYLLISRIIIREKKIKAAPIIQNTDELYVLNKLATCLYVQTRIIPEHAEKGEVLLPLRFQCKINPKQISTSHLLVFSIQYEIPPQLHFFLQLSQLLCRHTCHRYIPNHLIKLHLQNQASM